MTTNFESPKKDSLEDKINREIKKGKVIEKVKKGAGNVTKVAVALAAAGYVADSKLGQGALKVGETIVAETVLHNAGTVGGRKTYRVGDHLTFSEIQKNIQEKAENPQNPKDHCKSP